MHWFYDLVHLVAVALVAIGLSQNLLYMLQLLLAARALRPDRVRIDSAALWNRYSGTCPPISLLAPAYNEEMGIVESTKALLALQYPRMEIIVINDGSRDRTLELMISAFSLRPAQRIYQTQLQHQPIRALYNSTEYPNLVVVDKENGGKADALNAGINVARAPLFCAMDSDSIVEPDALLRMVQPFVDQPDRTVAVGGSVRIVNGCRVSGGQVVQVATPGRLVVLFQIVEYLRAFLIARVAWSRLNTLTLISGAFGLFRRDIAMSVGGYSVDTVGEDLDLVLKMHGRMIEESREYDIVFLPEPLCWTEAPESLAVLKRQRSRWQRGALEVFFRHRHMLFNPRYGRIGTVGMGQIFLVDVVGPLAEMLGYVLLPALWLSGGLSVDYMLAFLAMVFLLGTFSSVASLVLSEAATRRYPDVSDLAKLSAAAFIENFGYRQLNGLWRLRGWWQFLRKDNRWEAMPRVGFKRD
jgi:cellulose synthase/poly-beta-1,6-N-acetylglucosamine synthase-like glycosyltransferase